MDLSVNKSVKSFLKKELENLYAAQVCGELKNGSVDIEVVQVDLSLFRMKRFGQNGS